MNDFEDQSPLPRGRNDVDAEEERECRDIGRSHCLRASAVPSRDTTLDLSTMSDNIFTRPLPKVTFEYLRKELIGEKNEDVRRGRDEVDTDEQRERRRGDCDGDVSSIDFGAPNTYDMSNDRSSAANVRGPDLECPDEESDDTVKAPAIFAPEDCRACERYDLDDSTRPADAKRGVPSWYLDCDVERDILERCEIDTSDTRPIWAVKLKRYPDGHIKEAKARFCVCKDEIERVMACLMRPPRF